MIILKIIGTVALFVFLIAYTIVYTITYCCYKSNSGEQAVKMKYKEFKDIYSINPERWEWKCNHSWEDVRVFKYRSTFYSRDRINILFNYINYFRVSLFFLAQEYKENFNFKTTNQSEGMKLIIQTAQQDIDALIAKSGKQIKTAKEITETIGKDTNLWH